MQLTPIQRIRTSLFLFVVGVARRMTVGVRAVLLDENKVLLVRQTYLPGWHFPGGGVEPGETAETAGIRETLEETGYAVSGRAQLHGLFLNRSIASDRDHVAVYVWRNFTKQREFAANYEIADCRWFDLDALPDDIEPGTGARLREIASGTPPSAEWQP